MKEYEFRKWIESNNYSKKVSSDLVSRVKKIEFLSNSDIDLFFNIDKNLKIDKILINNVTELNKIKYKNTYNYAVKKYFEFLDSEQKK